MSQGFDPNQADPTLSEAAPTGELPDDFFAGPGRAGNGLDVESTPADGGPLPPRRPVAPDEARGWMAWRPILPIVGAVLLGNVVLFLGGLLAGWALALKSAPVRAGGPPTDPNALLTAVAGAVETGATRAEVERLRSEVAALNRRLAQLQGQFEARPAPAPAPDLGPLQARVDDVSQAVRRLSALPEGLRALDRRIEALDGGSRALAGRVGGLDEALQTLRGEVASQAERLTRAEPATPDANPPTRREGDAAEPAPVEATVVGAGLFKEGRYAEARDLFLKLAESDPDDARPWYYAALANGCATQDWRGETERLVKRGIERERAGTPGRAEIDALFDGLANPQVADWLRAWRQRALRP